MEGSLRISEIYFKWFSKWIAKLPNIAKIFGVGEDNLTIFMAVFSIKNVHSEMLFVNLKLVFFNGSKSINDTFNTIF